MRLLVLAIIFAVLLIARRLILPKLRARRSEKPGQAFRQVKNKSLYTVLVFARLNTRRFFRDRLALFFGIAFPVIFLFVFGSLFGKSGNNVSFRVALINQSDSSFAQTFVGQIKSDKLFKVDPKISDIDAAKDKMSRSQLDATVVLPAGFGDIKNGTTPTGEAQVIYTQNNEQAGQTLVTLLDAEFKGINSKFVSVSPPFTVKGEQTANKSLTQFDYTFAGLLGFSIIGLGIFGPINVFPELKKQGILRRLHTTPLKVWQYFVSTAISQAIVGLVSLGVLFAIAITVFHLHVVGNWLEIVAWLVLSIVAILGVGLAIGGWARNERQAAPLGNLIVFPMMFLSGTFFPRFLMPEWLQRLSAFLPLTPVIDGIRLITTEGKHFSQLLPQLGLLGGWLIVIYIIAFTVFRWE